MRTVIYVAPFPLETTMLFSRALAGVPGVRLVGVFQKPPAPSDARYFAHVELVANTFDVAEVTEACRRVAAQTGGLHRVLGILEDMQEQLAAVRAELGLPGVDVETARNFRDKSRMKDVLRAAGLPCARHKLVTEPAHAWQFVDQVGFPIVLKPPAGAGCRATYRVAHPQELAAALADIADALAQGHAVLAEEFLTGAEYSYETLTVEGVPKLTSLTRYYPSPLEVMESDWIQWAVVAPRRIDGPEFDAVHALAPRVIDALGLGTAMTHMEWFQRPDGSLAIGEIAARPPGAQIVKLTGYAHDRDMHAAWARLMIDGVVDGRWDRKYASGVAFLRGAGQGRVATIEGLDAAQQRMGHLVVEAKLPQVGAPRRPGYEGEGYAIVRHPETKVVKQAIMELITTVKVGYSA